MPGFLLTNRENGSCCVTMKKISLLIPLHTGTPSCKNTGTPALYSAMYSKWYPKFAIINSLHQPLQYIVGYDWKNAFVSGSQIKFNFRAINKAQEDAILKELSGTDLAMTIVKDGTLQGEKSMADRKEPLKYKAYRKDGQTELMINGEREYKMETLVPGESLVFVIHDSAGFDWKKTADTTELANPDSFLFITPNIIEEDVTLSEQSGTGINLDITKGDIYQFTVPSAMTNNTLFQFKAMEKSSQTPVLVNGQPLFSASPSIPRAPLTTLVVHKEGIY